MYLLTANDRDWRKYWETMPGGAEEALVQLKKKFDEKKCDKYILINVRYIPDLVQCLLENAKPFTSKELPDDGTNIVVLSHNWESTKLRNLKVKKLAQNLCSGGRTS